MKHALKCLLLCPRINLELLYVSFESWLFCLAQIVIFLLRLLLSLLFISSQPYFSKKNNNRRRSEVREDEKKMKGVERIFLSRALSSRDTSTPMCHKDMKFFLHLPPYVSSSQSSFLLFPYIIRKRLRILFIDITYTYDTHTSHFSI